MTDCTKCQKIRNWLSIKWTEFQLLDFNGKLKLFVVALVAMIILTLVFGGQARAQQPEAHKAQDERVPVDLSKSKIVESPFAVFATKKEFVQSGVWYWHSSQSPALCFNEYGVCIGATNKAYNMLRSKMCHIDF